MQVLPKSFRWVSILVFMYLNDNDLDAIKYIKPREITTHIVVHV